MRAPESTVRWAFGLPSSPSVPSPPQLRVKELKEILQSLGLPRSGNKQDLVNRILHFTEQGDPSEFAISRRGGPVPFALSMVERIVRQHDLHLNVEHAAQTQLRKPPRNSGPASTCA